MRINKIFRDFIEFAILLGVWTICFSNIKVGHHDFVTPLLLFSYALSAIINFIVQIIISTRSLKKELSLKLQRFKIFSIVFSLPIIGFVYFGELDILLFPLIISALIIFYYIGLILFIFIVKLIFNERFNIWLKERKHQIYFITTIIIFSVPHIVVYYYYEQNKTHEESWKTALESDSEEDYKFYLRRYPSGKYHEELTFRLAKKLNTLDAYEDYISKYPNGKYLIEYKFNYARLSNNIDSVKSYLKKYSGCSTYGFNARELEFLLDNAPNTFLDKRDGQIYNTIKIGNQTWMCENLNIKTDNSISYSELSNSIESKNYGTLYNKDDAFTICPDGWHIPSVLEWQTLRDTVLGYTPNLSYVYSCKYLKSRGGWGRYNGTNTIGFSAYPTGFVESKGGINTLYREGVASYWWSYDKKGFNYWQLHSVAEYKLDISDNLYLPIRCVKN